MSLPAQRQLGRTTSSLAPKPTTAQAAASTGFWRRCGSTAVAIVSAAIAPILGDPLPAVASCNQIPSAVTSYRGQVGNTDRPFVGPGDTMTIRLSDSCDDESPGFLADASDHVATFVFKPAEGPRNLVFLAINTYGFEWYQYGAHYYSANALSASTPYSFNLNGSHNSQRLSYEQHYVVNYGWVFPFEPMENTIVFTHYTASLMMWAVLDYVSSSCE